MISSDCIRHTGRQSYANQIHPFPERVKTKSSDRKSIHLGSNNSVFNLVSNRQDGHFFLSNHVSDAFNGLTVW